MKNINFAKKTFYQSCFEKYRNNIKKTWSTIKEISDKTSQRKQLRESFNIDGLAVTDKRVIANKFNDFFTSIGLKLANKIKNVNTTYNNYLKNPSMHTFQFKSKYAGLSV